MHTLPLRNVFLPQHLAFSLIFFLNKPVLVEILLDPFIDL